MPKCRRTTALSLIPAAARVQLCTATLEVFEIKQIDQKSRLVQLKIEKGVYLTSAKSFENVTLNFQNFRKFKVTFSKFFKLCKMFAFGRTGRNFPPLITCWTTFSRPKLYALFVGGNGNNDINGEPQLR